MYVSDTEGKVVAFSSTLTHNGSQVINLIISQCPCKYYFTAKSTLGYVKYSTEHCLPVPPFNQNFPSSKVLLPGESFPNNTKQGRD